MILDIIIILPILWGAYEGFKKGFLMELVGLLAFVLAILIGFKCMDYGLRFVLDYIGDLGKFLPFVGFILVFGLAFFVLLTSGKLAKKILDYTVFGSFDDIAGAILGIVKWSMPVSMLFWLVARTGIEFPEKMVEESVLYSYFLKAGPYIIQAFSYIVPFTKDIIYDVADLFTKFV